MNRERSHHDGAAMVYEFEELRFDGVSGQLTSLDGQAVSSLSPQPAALLLLLLEHAGELVTHETIRNRLWPDSEVEYDQGVHFCIRQIRTALGDSAKSPSYVATQAKRGYTFVAPARPISAGKLDSPSQQMNKLKPVLIVGGIILILASVFGYFSFKPTDSSKPAPIPIAIMPMTYLPDQNLSQSAAALAMNLVADLTPDRRLSIIGPTTTAQFSDEVALMKAASEITVSFIINGRFIRRDEDVIMFGEVVRTSDGAHIWVHRFELPLDTASASIMIQKAIEEYILAEVSVELESD